MSLNAIARPAAREPGPLVTLVRCRTVAKVDSIVIWSPKGGRDRDLGCFVEDSVLDETA
jgi:hypothetical protein